MIGDVLASTAICQALKSAWPDCEVHYMIHKNTAAVVENNPHVDRIIYFDPSQTKGIPALMAFGKELRKNRYDALIDAYGKWESIIPAVFSGSKIRIGHKKWYTSLFYTRTVIPKKEVSGSAIYHRLQLAQALTGKFIDTGFPKIYLKDAEITSAKKILSEKTDPQKPLLMISVLGSNQLKSLPAKEMAETLDIIAENRNIQMVFNFMPSQEKEACEIYDLCLPETKSKILFDLYTKGLREFLAVLSQCDALIGNEGGAVNMAKALRIPTFTIFSPWVNKSSWDMLNDEENHVSVHLNDYFPEIYNGRHAKEFKSEVPELYKKLSPSLFRQKLADFVTRIIS